MCIRDSKTIEGPNCRCDSGIGISNTPKKCAEELNESYASADSDAVSYTHLGNVGDGYTKEMAYDDLFHGIIESIVYPRDKVYSDMVHR